MKKSKILTLLLLSLGVTLVAAACGKNTGNSQSESESVSSSSYSESQSDSSVEEITSDRNYTGNWELSGNVADYYFVNADKGGALESELAVKSMSVAVGKYVTVTVPVVIDGEGNVLDVRYTVKTKDGADADLEGGAFFATDSKGYIVTFSFSTLDNVEHTAEMSVEVLGADEFYTDGVFSMPLKDCFSLLPLELINLTGVQADSYDLNSLVAKEDIEKLNAVETGVEWSLLPGFGGEEIALSNTVVNLRDSEEENYVEQGNYLLVASTTEGGVEKVLYAKNIDFYDLNDGLVWNTTDENLSRVSLSGISDITTLSAVKEGVPAGGNGGWYYKVQSGDGTNLSQSYVFMLNAMHSKEYYELFRGQGYSISFDYWLEASNPVEEGTDTLMMDGEKVAGVAGVFGWSYYKNSRAQFGANKWNTFTYDIDDYNSVWTGLLSLESLFYAKLDGSPACNAKNSTLYVGNVRIEQDLSVISGGYELIDVRGVEQYDLYNLLDDATKTKLQAQSGVVWELTPVRGADSIVLTDSIVNFEEVNKEYYYVSAKKDGLYLFLMEVDFYDSSEEVIWNMVRSTDDITLKSGLGKVNVSIVENPYGTMGKYFFFDAHGGFGYAFDPIHSKEYYLLHQGKEAILKFNVLINATKDVNLIVNGNTSGVNHGAASFGKWLEKEIPLDTLLENWDKLASAANPTDWKANFMKNNSEVDVVVYVGDFHISANVEGAVDNPLVALVNVNGNGNGYDLTKLFDDDEAGKATYEKYAALGDVEWTLTAALTDGTLVGAPTVAEDAFADFGAGIDKRLYKVEAKWLMYGGSVIYTRMVDFYDEADGMVWNDGVMSKDVALYSGGHTTVTDIEAADMNAEIAVASQATGARFVKMVSEGDAEVNNGLADSYGFMLLPIHSKAYYELPVWADYTLKFDLYLSHSGEDFLAYKNVDGVVEMYEPLTGTAYSQGMGLYGHIEQSGWGSQESTYRVQPHINKWMTLTLRLSDYMLKTWDWENLGKNSTSRMVGIENKGPCKSNTPLTKADGTEIQTEHGTYVYLKKTVAYCGNFRTEKVVEE